MLFCNACRQSASDKSKESRQDSIAKIDSISAKVPDIKTLKAIPFDSLSIEMKNAKQISPNDKNQKKELNGTTYEIISSTKTNFRDSYQACRQTDYMCKYLVESRKYTTWKDGKAESVWMETVSIFMGCGTW